jgi:hypothetical protein
MLRRVAVYICRIVSIGRPKSSLWHGDRLPSVEYSGHIVKLRHFETLVGKPFAVITSPTACFGVHEGVYTFRYFLSPVALETLDAEMKS